MTQTVSWRAKRTPDTELKCAICKLFGIDPSITQSFKVEFDTEGRVCITTTQVIKSIFEDKYIMRSIARDYELVLKNSTDLDRDSSNAE